MPAPSQVRSSSRRRAPRVSGEERETAILATLRQLLAERPWHTIAVDDLARGAGISRPTFYFYFASREAALLAVLEGLVERVLHLQAEAPEMLAHDREGAWRTALGASLATWVGNRDVSRAAAEARSSDEAINRLWTGLLEVYVQQTTEIIEAERAAGSAPAGAPARDLAICLNRMSERIYESSLWGEDPTIPEERLLDTLVDVWIRAIYGTVH